MLYKTCRQYISTQTIDRGGHTGINKSYALFSLASKPWHQQNASTRVSQPQQGPRSGLFGYQRLNGCRSSIFRARAASYESGKIDMIWRGLSASSKEENKPIRNLSSSVLTKGAFPCLGRRCFLPF